MTDAQKPEKLSAAELLGIDRRHLWHPFTPMAAWRAGDPLLIERGDGPYLFDAQGHRYIDGISSLWCNVHGHHVPQIDQAIREQLEKIAHSTLLGLASEPSIRLAGELVRRAPRDERGKGTVLTSRDREGAEDLPLGQKGPLPHGRGSSEPDPSERGPLNKVFYSDAGATAIEVALKMAVGYWFYMGRPQRRKIIALGGAYHGDTTGSMSVGYSELFHRPFESMVFPVLWCPQPDACRSALLDTVRPIGWPSEDPVLAAAIKKHCLGELERLLTEHEDEIAAILIEPVMQGAAGMICQPHGFVRGVAELAARHGVLWIADEVATGFGRTGRMFACEHEGVQPDIMCVAKGITGGYLPLAATLCTDQVEQAFCGTPIEPRTFYHGHTYTGNALGCAAALASLALFDSTNLIGHIQTSAAIISQRLEALRDCPHVLDIRQRGIMVGIELCRDRATHQAFDGAEKVGAAVCLAMRPKGLILRPLGDVVVMMPIPAMAHEVLNQMLDIVVETIAGWPV
jgi:adenosylmethionine-8-amino-7-oxononanoate aminotransferase